jgi:subtilisin family serine protease
VAGARSSFTHARTVLCLLPIRPIELNANARLRLEANGSAWPPDCSAINVLTLVRRVSFAGLTALLLLVSAARSDAAGAQKVDLALESALKRGAPTHHVIISVNPGCRAGVRQALEKHGDVVQDEYPAIDAADANAYAKSGCIRAVSADALVYAVGIQGNETTSAVLEGSQGSKSIPPLKSTLRDTMGLPHYAALDATVPTGATGITTAIIDSGIQPNGDFSGRIAGFWDFTNGGVATAAYDDYGHGTHIAGLIGSSGKLTNYEFQGIAPDIHFLGFKVLDKTGAGRTSDVIHAIEFVIAHKAKLNVQIINLSLGHPVFALAASDPLVQAVEQASAAGLIVVVSNGNYGQRPDGTTGYAGVTSPANARSAISVGTVMTQDTVQRNDDRVAPYSSRGPSWYDARAKPDVVAPGHRLASDAAIDSRLYRRALESRKTGTSKNGQPLLVLSGSSMSAAVTTGVVALVLQAHHESGFHNHKALTPNFVKALLDYSAIRAANADYLTQGAGEINAAGAIALARAIDTSRPAGSWWLGTGVSPYTKIGNTTHAWAANVLWGDSVLLGDSIFGNLPAWRKNVAWGNNILWGDNVVWAI